MRRILLITLLLATVTVAEPALQSRPPGLDLSGARIAALDEKVRQAEQAIADKRLTKGGRGGPAAQALLEGVLTADPFQPAALAAMERLIQALMAHAQDKLAAATPDLEGARDYWTKARDLVVAWRVSGSTAALDELRLAIDSRELAAARQAELAAREALQERQPALSAAEPPQNNRNHPAGLMDMASLIALLLLAASLFGLARTGLAKRLAKTKAARVRLAEENARLQAEGLDHRLVQQLAIPASSGLPALMPSGQDGLAARLVADVDEGMIEAQAQQSQKNEPPPRFKGEANPTAPKGGTGRITLRSHPRTLDKSDVKAMLAQRGYFDKDWNKGGKGLANDFLGNGNDTVTDRATGLTWQQRGSMNAMSYAQAEDYVKQLNREGFASHDDWRLPTLEEAASLLEPKQLNGDLYIDPVFDTTQHRIWTTDKMEGAAAVWFVNFYCGVVLWGDTDVIFLFVRVCRASGQ